MTTRTIYWGYTIHHHQEGGVESFTVEDSHGVQLGAKPYVSMHKARWAIDRHLEQQERLQNGAMAEGA